MRLRDPFVPEFLALLFIMLAVVTIDAQAYMFGELNVCHSDQKFEGRIDSAFDQALFNADRSTSEDIFNTERAKCIGGIFGAGVIRDNNLLEGFIAIAPNSKIRTDNEFGAAKARMDTISAGVSTGRVFYDRLAVKVGAAVHKTRVKVHVWQPDGSGGLDEQHYELSDVTYGLTGGLEFKLTRNTSLSYTVLKNVGDADSVGTGSRQFLGVRYLF
ncbi:MAG: hypothetical protein AB2745_08525 [Candidatus Thiodiazotropha endolucinida]